MSRSTGDSPRNEVIRRCLSPILVAMLCFSGCGYTGKMLLPDHIKSVHVKEVENKIDISGEITSSQGFQAYRPGLETELRNAVIERFIFDGHLKIQPRNKADAILDMQLMRFERNPLRYKDDDTVEEFRVLVVASAEFYDVREKKNIWLSGGISGHEDYFLDGELAISEDEAVGEALEDLSRHLVESILEIW